MDLAEELQHHLSVPHGDVQAPAGHQYRVECATGDFVASESFAGVELVDSGDGADGRKGNALGGHERGYHVDDSVAKAGGSADRQRRGEHLVPCPSGSGDVPVAVGDEVVSKLEGRGKCAGRKGGVEGGGSDGEGSGQTEGSHGVEGADLLQSGDIEAKEADIDGLRKNGEDFAAESANE